MLISPPLPPPFSYFYGQPFICRNPFTETSQRAQKSCRSQRKTTLKRITIQPAFARPSPLLLPPLLLPVCQRVQVITSRKEVMFVLSTYSMCVFFILFYVHVGEIEERQKKRGDVCVDKHHCLKAFFFFLQLFWDVSVWSCGGEKWTLRMQLEKGFEEGGRKWSDKGKGSSVFSSVSDSRWRHAASGPLSAGLEEVNSYYGWSLVAETSQAITHVRRTHTHWKTPEDAERDRR